MKLLLVSGVAEEVLDDASFVVGLKRLGELVDISVHDGCYVGQGQSYTVIRNSVLHKVVCSNLLAPVGAANELPSRVPSLNDFRLEFAIKKTRFEHAVSPCLVHMLTSFVLHRNRYARRDMCEADCRLCFVDVLSASTSRPHDFNLNVLVLVELFLHPRVANGSFTLEGQNLT